MAGEMHWFVSVATCFPDPIFYGSGSKSLDPSPDFTEPDYYRSYPLESLLINQFFSTLGILMRKKSFHQVKLNLPVAKGRKYA
jgi:hypothetical protein